MEQPNICDDCEITNPLEFARLCAILPKSGLFVSVELDKGGNITVYVTLHQCDDDGRKTRPRFVHHPATKFIRGEMQRLRWYPPSVPLEPAG